MNTSTEFYTLFPWVKDLFIMYFVLCALGYEKHFVSTEIAS